MTRGTSSVEILTGGAGVDAFVLADELGTDRDTGIADGTDRIQIESGADSFADLAIKLLGDDALIHFYGTTIRLKGVQISTLDQSDFLFS
ncbi:hypothetical protein HEP89_19800 [Labrenzia sp. 5N]|uniref:hypothetical protein n=1 Tax=Labrenzia sp. 5N TaxID=2723402 RepID=UPI00144862C4|nr:hypothetical protein [Labrenzia sp. 5N]NKX66375.1 hypothetical protein [Labrenzia sp. 5N]